MAKSFTEGLKVTFRPITLVLETAKEARALRDLLGSSTGDILYKVFQPYNSEYEKQKEVIENAVSRHRDD